ncbi:MAG: 2,3-bisphosphoglycerate-independent phosphoglycerate mutase [Bacteroidota bacterium]|jgi:bisphosphoglycerate-independent phosphoglycerate mutase (AlkP superfamily)
MNKIKCNPKLHFIDENVLRTRVKLTKLSFTHSLPPKCGFARRANELTKTLINEVLPNENYLNQSKNLFFSTMTRYDESFKNVHILYEKDDIVRTLGEVLANAGKTQIRIAETEKYPHVTFFLTAGANNPSKTKPAF